MLPALFLCDMLSSPNASIAGISHQQPPTLRSVLVCVCFVYALFACKRDERCILIIISTIIIIAIETPFEPRLDIW